MWIYSTSVKEVKEKGSANKVNKSFRASQRATGRRNKEFWMTYVSLIILAEWKWCWPFRGSDKWMQQDEGPNIIMLDVNSLAGQIYIDWEQWDEQNTPPQVIKCHSQSPIRLSSQLEPRLLGLSGWFFHRMSCDEWARVNWGEYKVWGGDIWEKSKACKIDLHRSVMFRVSQR